MAKPELGIKRVCPVTGRKFYDLNKDPVISPYTGEVVPIAPVASSRGRPEASTANARAPKEQDEEAVDREEEFVSLEEADAETTGSGQKSVPADDDDDIDTDDDTSDDDTLIEDGEEESDDVSDIVGDRDDEDDT